MRILVAFGLLAAIVVASNSNLQSQDKKDPPKTIRGQLPANWGKLNLTVDQKQNIYKIQAKYKEEIAKLEATIAEKKAEQVREMVKVLTDEQKKKLQELATGGSKDDAK